jgi:hypothetical protein
MGSWAGGTLVIGENMVAEMLADLSRRNLKPITPREWKRPENAEPAVISTKLLFDDVAAAKRSLDALAPEVRRHARKIIAASHFEGRDVAVLELGLRLPMRQAAESIRGLLAAGGKLLGVHGDDSFDADRLLVLLADPTATDPAELVDPGLSDSAEKAVKA